MPTLQSIKAAALGHGDRSDVNVKSEEQTVLNGEHGECALYDICRD